MPEYSELPERVQKALDAARPDEQAIEPRVARFSHVQPRAGDGEGDTEVVDAVPFTHHFVDAPGDDETVRWHYVECGRPDGEPVVFLHGIPASWFQWCHQMAAFAATHRCIAVDLKGYGQSDTKPGDFRHEGAAEQLLAMLRQIGVTRFDLVTHDRGTVQGDVITARHPECVLRYARGEQHLYHFNPVLAPQEATFRDAPWTGAMEDPVRFVAGGYASGAKRPIPDGEMERVIQEFAYPGVTHAAPMYFNCSTFRQEWLARRDRLLASWRCPVMILQGHDSDMQPREFYEDARDYIPNASTVAVRYIPGGHFWTLESPDETTAAIRELLAMDARVSTARAGAHGSRQDG